MVRYQNTKSQSSEASLDVSTPVLLGQINIPAVNPQLPNVGFTLTYTVPVVLSSGSGQVVFSVRKNGVTNTPTNTQVKTVDSSDLSVSGSFSSLTIQADTTWYITADVSSLPGSRAVDLLIPVATTLTLALFNSAGSAITKAKPGDTVYAKGNLKRTQAGTPIVGATVNLRNIPSLQLVNDAETDGSGNYVISFPVPTVNSVYRYRTEYEGSGFLSSSVSGVVGLALGDANWLPLLALAALTIYQVTSK